METITEQYINGDYTVLCTFYSIMMSAYFNEYQVSSFYLLNSLLIFYLLILILILYLECFPKKCMHILVFIFISSLTFNFLTVVQWGTRVKIVEFIFELAFIIFGFLFYCLIAKPRYKDILNDNSFKHKCDQIKIKLCINQEKLPSFHFKLSNPYSSRFAWKIKYLEFILAK